MQYVSGRKINQDFGVPGITTNDTVVNVDGRIAVGIGTTATANIDTNTLRIRDTVVDATGFSGDLGYFLTKDSDGLIWTEVSPITSNSIFVADNGNILGVSSFTGLNIISDQLLGVTTNTTNTNFADIRIDPRWFRDKTPGGGGGIYTTGTVGIGLTQPRLGAVGVLTDVKLDVLGDAIFSGIISATSFIGEFNVDTKDLNVSGIASFNGTTDNVIGDTNTGIVQIDGGVGIDKSVSIGSSLDVNNLLTVGSAVTIGNGAVIANTGDFINLELDNLNVSGFSTFNDTARFDGEVNIFDDLFVSGNISVGGTGVTLDTESIRIEGKELLIGFTTTITPNDTTANAAGIAVASTEGYFLVDLQVPGINTTPNTYKQIKWFKDGTFVGQGTDAFISNQPISIGRTQIGNGQLFAVGDNINFTEDKITAPTFVGNLTGTASTASFATTAFTLDGRVESEFNVATAVTATNVIGGIGSLTSLSVSGISTFVGIATFGTLGIGTANVIGDDKLTIIGDARLGGVNDTLRVGNDISMSAGIITALKLEGEGGTIIDISGGGTVITGIVTIGESSITLDGTNGTESIVIGSGITLSAVSDSTFANSVDINSDLDVSGVSTLGTVKISAGVVTATTGIVTYYGDGQYLENIISGVGIQSSGTVIGTGFTTLNFIGTGNTIVSIGNTVNISINSSEFAGFAQTAGIATNLANGAGGEIVYQSDTNTTAFLSNGTVGQVLVSSGGTGAPSWQNGASTGAIDGITIIDEVDTVGSAGSVSILNFKGSAITATASGNISTITVTIPSIPDVNGSAGIASTARDVIGGIASVTSLSVSGISTLGTVEINAGVITATSGIVTYYGDGQYLDNIITENEISNQSVAFAQTAGIATNVIGGIGSLTSLRVSGISTLGTVKIDAGIITSTTGTPVTYFGNLTGTASTASFATTAFTLNNRVESDFNVAFAQTAGIATNVIGGIASVTSLSVSGVSTLGTVKIDAGIITSTTGTPVTYFGNLTGTASTASFATTAFTLDGRVESDFNVAFAQTAGIATEATRLQTSRTFEITGDVVASPITFDGTGNVSLAATIQPNSVGLGTDTFGDYVKSITGTSNEVTVSVTSGEGSTPQIGLPNDVTIGQDLTVTRDVEINRNLNVNGNITIGGTSATLFTQTLTVADPDLILGVRTDALGNDISTDNTANHGGIAIASTEGNPLITLTNPGVGETLPSTYKKIMWFKSGSFTGLGTDAWLSNYAIGIGSTQFPTGTRLAAGSVQFTENDLAAVRNINSSGIVTSTAFSGSGASLNNIPNSALDNSSVSYGGVQLSLGASDATPAFDLSDAINYPYTSLAGITTEIVGDTTPQLGGNLDLNSKFITGTGGVNVSGIVTATSFSGSGASLNNIPNSALDNSSVSYGGVQLSLGASDATPAFDLSDATSYPYTSLTGITTEIVGDTTPQLGGLLDTNGNNILFSGTDRAIFGSGSGGDFEIMYTNSNYGVTNSTTLRNLSGDLIIGTYTSGEIFGDDVIIESADDFEVRLGTGFNCGSGTTAIYATGGGSVALNHNGSTKFETTGSGVTVFGTISATEFSGGGSNLTGLTGASASTYGDASNVAQIVVDANGRITGISNVAISGGGTNGVTIENNGSPVGTAITTINFSSNVTATASGSIATITSSGGSGESGEFNTGITSSRQIAPLSFETTVFTFPSTAGRQYVIESINVANIDASVGGGTTVNIIASIQDATAAEQTYIAYNVPIVTGGLIELIKNPIVAGPSDVIRMWSTNDGYTGVSNATEVYMSYSEFESTDFISKFASTTTINSTDTITLYTSTSNPTAIEKIGFANRTDIGDFPISIKITNGTTTSYLAKNLIIPRYSTVDILDRPKRIETGAKIEVEVGSTSTVDVIISGKKITS